MPASDRVHEGYLVIGDISGYSRFVGSTELEHAQSIIAELASLMILALAPPLRFIKPEGDAILCCADASAFTDGERLLELLEVCYLQFATRRREMAAATSCTCTACASIGTLDLKFVCHYGTYLAQPVGGMEDVAGPDVVLVHRLLKNSIAERTGSRAYVFFTDACSARLPAALRLTPHTEEIDSIGTVSGGVCDLRPVLEGERQTAGEYIDSADADFEFSGTGPVPPAVLWQYFIDPEKQLQWRTDMKAFRSNESNEHGRIGVGAVSHCDHGSVEVAHSIVDWRPFRYYTTVDTPMKRSFFFSSDATTTVEFSPTDDGQTNVSFRVRLHDRSWSSRMKLRLTAPLARRLFSKNVQLLLELLARDGLLAPPSSVD